MAEDMTIDDLPRATELTAAADGLAWLIDDKWFTYDHTVSAYRVTLAMATVDEHVRYATEVIHRVEAGLRQRGEAVTEESVRAVLGLG